MVGSNLAYYSSCSRMGEKNKHRILHSRCKAISTSVEFTFNASAIDVIPLTPNAFSIVFQSELLGINTTYIIPYLQVEWK